jgi:hypothetical protein
MSQPDMFSAPYIDGVGYKRHGTSEQAAKKIAPHVESIASLCYGLCLAAGKSGVTADEAAKILGVKPGATRPRFSEMASDKNGHVPIVEDSGIRRKNEDGNPVIVWIAI